jgi:dihydrofolate reductase
MTFPGGGRPKSVPSRGRHPAVTILTRLCTSLDGCVTSADGLPVQLAFPDWDAGRLGFYELQERCDAVLMGRTTFEPALGAPHWPWGELAVFVLGSHRPEGSPDHVVVDDDPVRLLERLREANHGGDVHLVGGPQTIETYRGLGALDEFRLLVLPMFAGAGRRVTPEVDVEASLEYVGTTAWPTGVVELVYRANS